MQLLIDQGNSSIKWCFYKKRDSAVLESNDDHGDKHTFIGMVSLDDIEFPVHSGSLQKLEAAVNTCSDNIDGIYISSVQKETKLQIIVDGIKQYTSAPVEIVQTANNYQGLKNSYEQIEKMGVDRWLVMLACWQQLKSGFIVVDAGSAMTLDIVDKSGQHLGGHIVPGLALQKHALQYGTDRVNFGKETKAVAFKPGTSTDGAVQNGCLTVLSSYITAMYQQNNVQGSLPLVITGGDAVVLSETLNVEHEVIPGLVLKGLYYFYSEKF
ncbi:MAG: type III pantothenate kinase [Gammaproteobacteria bacterium]|nr:type III pantothenate kinase [Gammaproteobacteria bacterium]